MRMTEVISVNGHQAVVLPEDFQLAEGLVSIRKLGEAVILEPAKSGSWPTDFFKSLHVEDPNFTRPPQGNLPPVPVIESH